MPLTKLSLAGNNTLSASEDMTQVKDGESGGQPTYAARQAIIF